MTVFAAATTTVVNATTNLYLGTSDRLGYAAPQALSRGLVGTANDQITQATAFFIGLGALVGIIAFLYVAGRARWAFGGVIQGLILGGLIVFAVGGGGTAWFANQVKDQLGV